MALYRMLGSFTERELKGKLLVRTSTYALVALDKVEVMDLDGVRTLVLVPEQGPHALRYLVNEQAKEPHNGDKEDG